VAQSPQPPSPQEFLWLPSEILNRGLSFFEPKFHQNIENKEYSTYSLPLIATNSDEYIKMATLLINDSNLYNEISEYQKLAGSTHFFDKKTLYHSHLKYIQKVTNMEIA